MAYARPFGQAQSASPWSAGVPPGIQQSQQAGQPTQQMFGQPMGPFDLSGGWQNQQQAGPQWMPAMQQPVQFVPNPAAYMQQNQNQHQMHRQQQSPHMRQQHQQQRPMHQRSLSAPRVSANGQNKRQFNNNNNSSNSGGQQRQYNNNQQQRTPRQQSRMNNNSNNNNNDHVNQKNSAQVNNRQQQQQQNQQQSQKKGNAKVTVKVTKVKKLNALKTKQGVNTSDNGGANTGKKAVPGAKPAAAKDQPTGEKVQSKTAERKQLKLQARKNAEALKQSILPVSKNSTGNNAQKSEANADEPIDQAQLKCVPAVFGFVCKICDVFLKDKIARREHIDSADHMKKFNLMEEEQKQESAEEEQKAKASEEEQAETSTGNLASTTEGEQKRSSDGPEAENNDTDEKDGQMKE